MSSLSAPLVCAFVLAVVFAWAGLAKIIAPRRWRRDLDAYRLSRPFRGGGWLVLPWLELLVTAATLTGYAKLSAGLALILLATFSATILRARILGGSDRLACGCFGGHTTRDYRVLLLRNAALAALAVYVLAAPPEPEGLRVLGPVQPLVPLALTALAVVAAGWILWQVRARFRNGVAAGPPA
jgi:hypothetical protein